MFHVLCVSIAIGVMSSLFHHSDGSIAIGVI